MKTEILDKVDVELLIEDLLPKLLEQNLEVHITKTREMDMCLDEWDVEVEIWYGDTKIDSDCVTVKG